MWPFDVELGPKYRRFEFCVLPFWYCVVLLWSGLLVFWVYLMFEDMRTTSKFETSGNLIGIWEIPFPAVTICSKWKLPNHLKVRKEPGLMKSALANPEVICKKDSVPDSDNPIDYKEILKNLRRPMIGCYWKRNLTDCSNVFHRTLTSDGPCYTFNTADIWSTSTNFINPPNSSTPHWDVSVGYSVDGKAEIHPSRMSLEGKRGGIDIVLVSYRKAPDDICSKAAPELKVMIHNPAEAPFPELGTIPISPNEEVSIEVRPYRISTAEELRARPKLRNCYFSNEKKLSLFNVYTQRNCEIECVVNQTINACGCAPFYMPHQNSTPVCGRSQYSCYIRAEDTYWNLRRVDPKNKSPCECKTDCGIDKYKYQAGVADFDWKPIMEMYNHTLAGTYMSRLSVFVDNSRIYADTHQLYISYHSMAGWGDFLFILTGLSFIMSFIITLILLRPEKIRRSSMGSPLLEDIQ